MREVFDMCTASPTSPTRRQVFSQRPTVKKAERWHHWNERKNEIWKDSQTVLSLLLFCYGFMFLKNRRSVTSTMECSALAEQFAIWKKLVSQNVVSVTSILSSTQIKSVFTRMDMVGDYRSRRPWSPESAHRDYFSTKNATKLFWTRSSERAMQTYFLLCKSPALWNFNLQQTLLEFIVLCLEIF